MVGIQAIRALNIEGCENISGNNLINSSNCKYSFEILSSKDANYSQFVQFNEDVMDCTVGYGNKLSYFNSVV